MPIFIFMIKIANQSTKWQCKEHSSITLLCMCMNFSGIYFNQKLYRNPRVVDARPNFNLFILLLMFFDSGRPCHSQYARTLRHFARHSAFSTFATFNDKIAQPFNCLAKKILYPRERVHT